MEIIQLDWEAISEIGGIGVAVITLIIGYRVLNNFISALNRNTESFENLSKVFKNQAEVERQFQANIIQYMKDDREVLNDTNRKVNRIYNQIVIDDQE